MISAFLKGQQTAKAYSVVVDELLRLTTSKNMNISQVAAAIHYDRTHIYNVISGRKNPSIDFLNSWAALFDRSVLVIVRPDNYAAGLVQKDCGAARKFANEMATAEK